MTTIKAHNMPDHIVLLGNSTRRSSFGITAHLLNMLLMVVSLITITIDSARADFPNSADYDYPIDFSLTLSNSNIDLREGNKHFAVDLNRINISIFTLEEKYLQFGFNAGSSYLSLDNDTVLAGVNLSGYHAGFAIRAQHGNNPQFGFHADYRYQETEDETEEQESTLSWHEWTVAATGKIILGQQLALTLGWAYSEINARRDTRGNLNDTLHMRLDSTPYAQFELAWLTGGGGQVSLALQNGAYENVAFRFAQTFK